jgi:N utilization substance protein A
MIEDFLARTEAELLAIEGVGVDDLASLHRIIEENVEVIEEEFESEPEPDADINPEETPEDLEDESYECPDCHAVVTPDMTNCPQCGVALSFEYEDEDAEDQES